MTPVRGEAPDVWTVYALQDGRRAGVRGEHFLAGDELSGRTTRHRLLRLAAALGRSRDLVDTGIALDVGRG